MAKKSGPNKSQAIRDYHAANPSVKPAAVSAALVAEGVVVTPAFVSTVLSTDKRKGGPKSKRKSAKVAPKAKMVAKGAPKAVSKRGRPAGVKAAAKSTGEVSLDSLIAVKKIVEQMGGVDDARNALLALEKLMG